MTPGTGCCTDCSRSLSSQEAPHNLSVFHDEDQRSVADRGQTVGNDETRSALHQLVKRLLNLQFGTGIDAGGRLVEDQHRRQAEHDTGDTKKLFLPLADAVFAENRVKSLRQTLDKLPAGCRARFPV